jgi:glyoxylase-like metal-dependent hydrolase (beta-lactamase superfamily II)
MLWDMVYGQSRPAADPDRDLTEGTTFRIAGSSLLALHTPGHSPGSTCLHSADLNTVFTGDTLFCGGPGATGRSFSDKPTILTSINARLMSLHGDTVVRTGHGDDTTISAETGNIS